MVQPIRVMASGLTNRIWALRRYREMPEGYVVSSSKDDVTEDAIRAVIEHIRRGCSLVDCGCQFLTQRAQCGRIYPVPVPGEVVKACALSPRHTGNHTDFNSVW